VSEERTEKATPRKLKESRKEGQVARSQDFGAWGAVLVVALGLGWLAPYALEQIQALLVQTLSPSAHADEGTALRMLGDGAALTFWIALAMGLGVMVIGVGAAVAQGGLFLATKTVKPKWSKLDPIKGAKRVFGPQAMWQGAKMLIKSTLVAVVAWRAIVHLMPLLGGLVPIPVALELASSAALAMMRDVALAGLVAAGVDYAMQRRRTGKQVRMTKKEVRDEHKQSEGDPLLKSALRSRQLAAARNRMMADVPTADVVLVNPTHVAVALRYDPAHGTPRVVAKGAGVVAAKIRELATEHRVTLVEDVPLARALHASCEIGQEIPRELYHAVAQVLAFVLSRRGAGAPTGRHPSPRDATPLPTLPRGRRRASPALPESSGPAPASR
jgi:flagellar biosynthetic protein FlhB